MLELKVTRVITGTIIGLVLVALTVLSLYARQAGILAEQLTQAEVRQVASEALYQAEKHRADSLAALVPRLQAAAVAAVAPHARATARTEVAEGHLLAVQDSALREAHGTLTPDSIRDVIARMALAESVFVVRVHQERDSAAARIAREGDARAALERTVGAQSLALAAADRALADKDAEIRVLKQLQPGVIHRAVRGLTVGGATAGCAGVGWLVAGPVGAIAGGAGCAVLAGVFAP